MEAERSWFLYSLDGNVLKNFIYRSETLLHIKYLSITNEYFFLPRRLVSLSLLNCSITLKDKDILSFCPTIEKLKISHSIIDTLLDLSKLKMLKKLSIEKSDISFSYFYSRSLEKFTLYGDIEKLPRNIKKIFPSLRKFKLKIEKDYQQSPKRVKIKKFKVIKYDKQLLNINVCNDKKRALRVSV
jgi:hypothetical protein